jgi:osmotically inducible protein OsmC
MLKRTSTAVWHGTGPKGTGTISTLSGALTEQPYGFNTRFTSEDGRAGTNPEELIAAAHAGCFTMALAARLGESGVTPERIETKATVTLEKLDSGFAITRVNLDVTVKAPGADRAKFDAAAANAKDNCPLSKVLRADISMDARLIA